MTVITVYYPTLALLGSFPISQNVDITPLP